MICKGCNKEFNYHRKKTYCSPECRLSTKKKELKPINCVQCGKEFKPRSSRSRYCCKKCRERAKRIIYKDKDWFKEGNKRRVKRYHKKHPSKRMRCVPPLRSKIAVNVCDITGVTFVSKGKTKILPKIQQQIILLRRYIDYHNRGGYIEVYLRSAKSYKEKQCAECGVLYLNNHSSSRFCSNDCCNKAHRRNATKKQKARLRAATVENVKYNVVFDRYNWHCAMCGIHTPRSMRGKHEYNSPELDHIIPLARGGEHSYSNTQLLCRRCNSKKSNKILYNNNNKYNNGGVGIVSKVDLAMNAP